MMLKKRNRFYNVIALLSMLLLLCFGTFVNAAASAEEETEDGIYTLTLMADGEVYSEQEYESGDIIDVPEAPEKEQFLFVEWEDLPDVMPEEDLTVYASYHFAGLPETELDAVYECDLSDWGMDLVMYLRVNDEGNFVFSRSTDFSDVEKGAGKVFKRSAVGELESGAYSVDISWSEMEGTIAPVVEIDAETMTFELYDAADPSVSKGCGVLFLEDGEYTMYYVDRDATTTFTIENGAVCFTYRFWLGSASVNLIDYL
ncbi:MAG: InlB B-repeat-containing protein [Lachnospiraceae bacterium]|nr:InlB B-repeat-containing protein [Lachnospiraceae bacterium]